ncbi:uncharacterized protein AB9W97_014099 [Spinachia spinachia]
MSSTILGAIGAPDAMWKVQPPIAFPMETRCRPVLVGTCDSDSSYAVRRAWFEASRTSPPCRVSKDGSLVVWVHVDNHLRLVSTRDDANIVEAFKCVCVNLQKRLPSSSPPALERV